MESKRMTKHKATEQEERLRLNWDEKPIPDDKSCGSQEELDEAVKDDDLGDLKKALAASNFSDKNELEKRKRQFRAVLETVEQYNLRKTIDHELKRQATLDKICKLVTPRKRDITNSLRTAMTDAKETIKQSKIRKRKNYESDSSEEAEDSDE